MIIKSLSRINEGEQNPKIAQAKEALERAKKYYEDVQRPPADIQYGQDIAKANEAYQKVRESEGVSKLTPWFLTPKPKVAEAHYDLHKSLDLADARRKAAKMGMVSKEDYDEMKFQLARKTAGDRAAKAVKSAAEESATSDKPGILRKIGGAIAEHPLLAAGTVAGIAGLAALQKRRKTEQPQQY
jgi:hypothetical protein